MKTLVENRLFWFLKEGTELDLSDKLHLDMFVQQTLSRGKTSDVRTLLSLVSPSEFSEAFVRIKHFLPKEVRRFWEEWLEDTDEPAKKDTPPVW